MKFSSNLTLPTCDTGQFISKISSINPAFGLHDNGWDRDIVQQALPPVDISVGAMGEDSCGDYTSIYEALNLEKSQTIDRGRILQIMFGEGEEFETIRKKLNFAQAGFVHFPFFKGGEEHPSFMAVKFINGSWYSKVRPFFDRLVLLGKDKHHFVLGV